MTELIRENAQWLEIKAKCAKDANCRPQDVDIFMDVYFEFIRNRATKNNDTMIKGFCTFSIRKKSAYNTRHWSTGLLYKVPARKYLHVVIPDSLKRRLKTVGY